MCFAGHSSCRQGAPHHTRRLCISRKSIRMVMFDELTFTCLALQLAQPDLVFPWNRRDGMLCTLIVVAHQITNQAAWAIGLHTRYEQRALLMDHQKMVRESRRTVHYASPRVPRWTIDPARLQLAQPHRIALHQGLACQKKSGSGQNACSCMCWLSSVIA